jgi:hypothetical protein
VRYNQPTSETSLSSGICKNIQTNDDDAVVVFLSPFGQP